MAVTNMTVGGTTPDGARFAVKVDGGGPVRVAMSTDPDVTPPPPVPVIIRAWGAQGGGGGLGGYAEGTFMLPPGTVLNVRVGGQGAAPSSGNGQTDPGVGLAGGFNGGGDGGYYFDDFNGLGNLRLGGSGGGASDVRWDGDALADRQVVGGGGGGASNHPAGTGGDGGGTAGLAGGSGPNTGVEGGGGGTALAGGAGGDNGGGTPGGDGTAGQGGDGGVWITFGNNGGGPGAGGGGHFGGGGGTTSTAGFGEAGGGGGGSGFVDPVATGTDLQMGVRSGHGRVEIEVDGIVTVFDHIGGPDTFELPTAADFAFTASQAVDVNGAAKLTITGLQPDTRYHWRVEDNGVLDSLTGQFLTHPPLGVPGKFTIGIVADAGLSPEHPGIGAVLAADRLSNAPVLDTIRQRALAEGWPMVCWLGDDLYYDLGSGDHGIPAPATLTQYRRARDDRLLQPRAHQLDREVAQTRQPDDHDRAQNNHDSTDPGGPLYNQVYREREPHYDLPDGDPQGGTYFDFTIRRTLFVAADVRTFKTGSTMLGAAQLAWMDQLLATTTAKFLVWLVPGQWMGTSVDSWGSYPGEAATVVAMLGDHGFAGRTAIIGADAHIVALDTGGPNSPGGIPVLQAAPIDASPGFGDPADYNLGGSAASRAQYGSVTVDDQGTQLVVTLTGWREAGQLVSHTFAVAGDPPPPLASGALLRTLSGSHRALVEARVVTEFTTGPDPAGVPIAILAGDVTLDGTAQIRGSLELETAGRDENTGQSLFPRHASDLLAPYGNQLFIRRGVDLGPDREPIWVPLGYYRIESAEQDDAPYGAIRLSGRDRMAGIVDARPLEPREFAADRTVASLFAELVGEVYPQAVVVFDDETAAQIVGRVLVMEDNRYDALAEVATALGKIMFWDGSGFLQVRTAPADDEPVWEVKHGAAGVLAQPGRRVSREGVHNGWVVTGEAGESETNPARGVAVDVGPDSPTRWGGPFGKVPRFFSSPFISTAAQATNAAREGLRRTLGAPYSVDFGAVVNPALAPHDPIRVEYADYNRELHIVETVSIPLQIGPTMTASTRQKTLVVIGGVPS